MDGLQISSSGHYSCHLIADKKMGIRKDAQRGGETKKAKSGKLNAF
jgi:hypothetical protein